MRNLLKKIFYSSIELFKSDAEGYSTISVLNGQTKGLTLRLKLQQESAYFWGSYDENLLVLINRIAKPDWSMWDCGTYIGMYTVFFAKITNNQGKVFSFEPDKVNLARTQQNVALNNFNHVTFVNIAVADTDGDLQFFVGGNTNSHLPIGWIGSTKEDYQKIEVKKETIQVKANTLNTMAELYGVPNFIKIDIEGAEITALNHAQKLVDSRKTIFLIESHNPETDARIFNFAKEANYLLRQAEQPNYPLIVDIKHSQGTMLAYPAEMKLGIE
jgi:FkbM family methyltransferase